MEIPGTMTLTAFVDRESHEPGLTVTESQHLQQELTRQKMTVQRDRSLVKFAAGEISVRQLRKIPLLDHHF